MTDTAVVTPHPAKFSQPVLDAIGAELRKQWVCDAQDIQGRRLTCLDPFAGVGTVFQIDAHADWWGVEIEPEWARQSDRITRADSRDMFFFDDDSFDTIVTSPAYGNRMADQYIPPETDKSRRYTYATSLGRPCSEGSGAALQWGTRYMDLHAAVWAECVRVLRPGGRFLLNVKDHYRKGERVPVASWHLDTLAELGLAPVLDLGLATDGIKDSPNRERCQERLIVLEKPA